MKKDFEFEKLDHRLIRGLYHLKTEESAYMKPNSQVKLATKHKSKFLSGSGLKDVFSRKSFLESAQAAKVVRKQVSEAIFEQKYS
jgi:hypothetical protein